MNVPKVANLGENSTRPIDEVDRRMLRALQAKPELSVAALSERIGLSQTPCWRRLKRLENEGVIVRRALILDERQLGLPISVLAHLKLQRHDEETLEALEADALKYPEIVECFSMSGESDYVMRVVAASVDDYERFLKRVLLHLPGVASVNSSFMLKSVKMTTDLPV